MPQVLIETLHIIEEQLQGRALGGTQTPSAVAQTTTTGSAPSPTMSGNPNNGGTSSPLLFFVALGFGVVFTNLWYDTITITISTICRSKANTYLGSLLVSSTASATMLVTARYEMAKTPILSAWTTCLRDRIDGGEKRS